jgi:Zn-finger nucleic acid-binding protein
MRKCPICNIELTPEDYEGVIVMQCAQCGGHLIPLQRFESIKRIATKTEHELKKEASTDFKYSTTNFINCPRCHMKMKKQSINIPVVELQTDICKGCKLIWLDGGELALLQLLHQSKSGFLNAQELKRRMQNLEADPERKAKFEAALAKLPDPDYIPENVLNEVGEEIINATLTSLFEIIDCTTDIDIDNK